MKTILLSLLIMFGLTSHAIAKDELSVTPESVWSMVQEDADKMLFVDVRDPVEIMFKLMRWISISLSSWSIALSLMMIKGFL